MVLYFAAAALKVQFRKMYHLIVDDVCVGRMHS